MDFWKFPKMVSIFLPHDFSNRNRNLSKLERCLVSHISCQWLLPRCTMKTGQVMAILRVEQFFYLYDDVIKWKHFPRYWPFVRGIHRSPVNSPHKGQWRGALMFSLICVWINDWVNNREAGDLRRYRAHDDVTVMVTLSMMSWICCTQLGIPTNIFLQKFCLYGTSLSQLNRPDKHRDKHTNKHANTKSGNTINSLLRVIANI